MPTTLSPVSSTSISDKAIKLISSLQSKFGKRDAVKYKVIQGHLFEVKLLTEPTFCSQCSNILWGLNGHECKLCKLVCHGNCSGKVESICVVDQPRIVAPVHEFKSNYFLKPTFCDHCGTLLTGIIGSQGLRCKTCDRNIHRECLSRICHPCSKRDSRSSKNNQVITKTNNVNSTLSGRIHAQDFQWLRTIGSGSSSKVYLARHVKSKKEYAVKVIKKTNPIVCGDPSSVFTEMKVLKLGAEFPFLSRVYCCFQSADRLFFVQEYVAGLSLVDHLERDRKFTEDKTRFYAAELVLALDYLHKNSVVHRDLKLNNVIIDLEGHCKLLDFGLCKELSTEIKTTRTFCGTPSYISPEVIKGQDYGFSVDWWALGVLMFEMLLGYSPFEADSEDKLYRSIEREDVKFPRSCLISTDAKDIMSDLLRKDPSVRIGSDGSRGLEMAIFQHKFFLFRTSQNDHGWHQWEAIRRKEIAPPHPSSTRALIELHKAEGLYGNVSMTPVDQDQLKRVSDIDFNGFSFYSQSFSSILDT